MSEATGGGGDDVVGEGEGGGPGGEDGQGDAGGAGDTRGAGNRQETEHLVISLASTGRDANGECGADEGGVPGGGRGVRGGAGDGGGERGVSPESGLQAQSTRSAVARPAYTGPLQNVTDTMSHEEQKQLANHPVRKSRRRVASEDALGLGLEKWLRKTDPCCPVAKQDGEPKTVPAQLTQAQPTAIPQPSSIRKAPLSASHSRERRKPDILADTADLSEYELQRLENIKSNEAFLKSLGLCNIPLQAKRR